MALLAQLPAFKRPRRDRRRARGAVRSVRWPPLAYVSAAVAVARARRRLGLPAPLCLAGAYATPLAVAMALPRGRPRAAAVWGAHMWAYKIAFEVPYDRPADLRRRLRIDEPIRADTRIGLGVPPTQRLQRTLRRPPKLRGLDRVATFVYALWEAEPHAALGFILLRHPARFPAAAVRLGATFDATLGGYFATPTAPPWWASEREGRMDREVRRVVVEVFNELRGRPRPGTDHAAGANPWASMPSDHFASALSAAIVLGEADRRAGALAGAYAFALALALLYTGEHYAVDLVAGGALSLLIQAAGRVAAEPATRLAAAVPAADGSRLRRGR